MMNSRIFKFPTDGANFKGTFWFLGPKSKRTKAQRAQHYEFVDSDGANCKGTFWFLGPKSKRTKAQRAQHYEFVDSGLETRLQ